MLTQKGSQTVFIYWWAIVFEGFAFNFSNPSSQYGVDQREGNGLLITRVKQRGCYV